MFDWIAVHFDPRRFELRDEGAEDYRGQIAEVRLREGGYRFTFRQEDGAWEADLSPGPETREASTRPLAWAEMGGVFRTWLNLVARELGAGDPWGEVERELQLASVPTPGESNDSFTAEEQRQIAERIREVRTHAVKEGLSGGGLDSLNARLDEIEDASTRVGRKDWKMIVLGSFSAIAAEAVIPPDVVRASFFILFHGIEHLFGLPGPPPELLA